MLLNYASFFEMKKQPKSSNSGSKKKRKGEGSSNNDDSQTSSDEERVVKVKKLRIKLHDALMNDKSTTKPITTSTRILTYDLDDHIKEVAAKMTSNPCFDDDDTRTMDSDDVSC